MRLSSLLRGSVEVDSKYEEDPLKGPIVVGTDASDLSNLAIAEAGLLARRFHRSVIVVFTRQLRWTEGAIYWDISDLAQAKDTLEMLAWASSITILDALGVSWSFLVRHGPPAVEISTIAREHRAALFVVACSHPLDRTKRRIRPASVRKLLSRWANPLLVVWPPGEELVFPSTPRNGSLRVEVGSAVLIRGGDGRCGQPTPPVWRRTLRS